MGTETDSEPSSTPKLSLFSVPSSCRVHEPSSSAGLLTPPIHTLASVPFKWEEVPGKPRPCMVTKSKPKAAKCLELPPRLLNEAKVSNMPSPTTVLDGPYNNNNNSYVGLSLSRSLSAGKGGSLTSSEKVESKEKFAFASSRWGGFKKNKEVVDASDDGGDTKAKITRIKRRSSFLHLPHPRSQLWTNMYESFKQVVPWKRRQEEKLRGKSSGA